MYGSDLVATGMWQSELYECHMDNNNKKSSHLCPYHNIIIFQSYGISYHFRSRQHKHTHIHAKQTTAVLLRETEKKNMYGKPENWGHSLMQYAIRYTTCIADWPTYICSWLLLSFYARVAHALCARKQKSREMNDTKMLTSSVRYDWHVLGMDCRRWPANDTTTTMQNQCNLLHFSPLHFSYVPKTSYFFA